MDSWAIHGLYLQLFEMRGRLLSFAPAFHIITGKPANPLESLVSGEFRTAAG